MSRSLFEYITQPEKSGPPRRVKIILLVSVLVFHAAVLYFAFTARMPIRILKLGTRVYSLKLVPPLPEVPSLGGPQGKIVGALPGGVQGQPGTPTGGLGRTGAAGKAQGRPAGGAAPSRGVPAGGLTAPFTLKVPVKPGPLGPEELQRGVIGGVAGTMNLRSNSTKFWAYTKTDPWGRSPIEGSGPGNAQSPGGPLGSPYELMGSGTGPKVFYKGNPSFVARGYNIGPWAKVVMGLLQKNWQLPALDRAKSTGKVGVTIIVERSGNLSTVRVVNSPSSQILVRAALDSITRSLPLPQLPDDYPGLVLEAYLLFDYHEIK